MFPGYDGFFILEKFILGFGGPQFLPVGEFDLMEEIFNIIYELRVEWGEKRRGFCVLLVYFFISNDTYVTGHIHKFGREI